MKNNNTVVAEKEDKPISDYVTSNFKNFTYDMFMFNMASDIEEINQFSEWIDLLKEKDIYAFEVVHKEAQRPLVKVVRENGTQMQLLNFSSYNYLGFGYEKSVLDCAKKALYQYGLGAASSPVVSGTYTVHKELEAGLLKFFNLKNKGISLFSSGYGVNLGAIQAFMKPGGCLLIDKSAHMSILEAARLSGADIDYFEHNDVEDLERLLKDYADDWTRVLVCIEGVYSADGDFGNVGDIVRLAKQYNAFTLVDEAHSALIAGEHGRGVSEEHGVLEDVDLYVMTFSKAFGGVGGALLADKAIIDYVNWYAKCRMFSCALDPAVTGGLVKVVELAGSDEGYKRRNRIKENADYFHSLLKGKVKIGNSKSWVIPIIYGNDRKTIDLNDYLQKKGLDSSVMQFPAVPKNEGRIRIFITSEHTKKHIKEAAEIILDAAEKFDFRSS